MGKELHNARARGWKLRRPGTVITVAIFGAILACGAAAGGS